MLQFDEYKVKLNNIAPTLKELAQALEHVTVAEVQDAARQVQLDTVFFLKGAAQ